MSDGLAHVLANYQTWTQILNPLLEKNGKARRKEKTIYFPKSSNNILENNDGIVFVFSNIIPSNQNRGIHIAIKNRLIQHKSQVKLLTPDPLPNERIDRAAQSRLKRGMLEVDSYEAVPSMQTS